MMPPIDKSKSNSNMFGADKKINRNFTKKTHNSSNNSSGNNGLSLVE